MLSSSVTDTSGVFRVMMVGDATTWSVTNDHHSDTSRGVIYNRNIFIIRATGLTPLSKTRLKNTLA